ncbi:hypothetical protein B0H19DRAFT_1245975 [Mycena capillaripes]|nr:hypothetical protein B0H19DRAFT_1245975 [Mycena capillaripes]
MMFIQLKPTAILACCALTAAINVSTPKPDLGNIFAVYPGWSMTVGNTNTFLGITELACQQVCSTDTACLAYVYFPYGGPNVPNALCTLKTSIDLADFTVEAGIVTSVGLIGGCGTSVDPPLRFFNPKTDGPGSFFA